MVRIEDAHGRGAIVAGDAAGRLEAVHLGHPDVHEDDVGPVAGREVHRFAPVGGLADDLDVFGRAEEDREPAAYQRLVVGHDDPDHAASV